MNYKTRRSIAFLIISIVIVFGISFLLRNLVVDSGLNNTRIINIGLVVGAIEVLLVSSVGRTILVYSKKKRKEEKDKNWEWNNNKIQIKAFDENNKSEIKVNIKSNKEFTKEQNKEITDFCNQHISKSENNGNNK